MNASSNVLGGLGEDSFGGVLSDDHLLCAPFVDPQTLFRW
jgi:hypothetical protein